METFSMLWLVWELSAVPDGYNPNRVRLDPVEKAIRSYDYLAKLKIGKFW